MVDIDSEPGVVCYKSWGNKVAIFGHSAGNFWQRRLWVLISSILSLYSPKMDFWHRILYVGKLFTNQKKFWQEFGEGGGTHPYPLSATTPLDRLWK